MLKGRESQMPKMQSKGKEVCVCVELGARISIIPQTFPSFDDHIRISILIQDNLLPRAPVHLVQLLPFCLGRKGIS